MRNIFALALIVMFAVGCSTAGSSSDSARRIVVDSDLISASYNAADALLAQKLARRSRSTGPGTTRNPQLSCKISRLADLA